MKHIYQKKINDILFTVFKSKDFNGYEVVLKNETNLQSFKKLHKLSNRLLREFKRNTNQIVSKVHYIGFHKSSSPAINVTYKKNIHGFRTRVIHK